MLFLERCSQMVEDAPSAVGSGCQHLCFGLLCTLPTLTLSPHPAPPLSHVKVYTLSKGTNTVHAMLEALGGMNNQWNLSVRKPWGSGLEPFWLRLNHLLLHADKVLDVNSSSLSPVFSLAGTLYSDWS